MARHKDIRNLDIDAERDNDNYIIGRSVDDEYSVSPEQAQYLYHRTRQLSQRQSTDCNIDEEHEEEDADNSFALADDSSGIYQYDMLSDLHKAKVQSCIDQVCSVIGGEEDHHFSNGDLIKAAIRHECCPESVISDLLDKVPESPKPQRVQQKRSKGDLQPAETAKYPPPLVTVSNGASAMPPPATPSAKPLLVSPQVASLSSKVTTGFLVSNDKPSSRCNSPIPSSPVPSSQLSRLLLNAHGGCTPDTLAGATSPLLGSRSPGMSSNRSSYANLDSAAKPRLKERPADGAKDLINLIVIGHVDAGKSTLMGHLLYLLGNVHQRTLHKYKQESQKMGKSSFAFAWILDETAEERERGVTMDIAQARFETTSKQVVLLDAPGHKDFIPNMISGAAQADVAILVVNATTGEFETGLDQGGQTREHTMLAKSLGVGQLAIAVNKLDTADWSQLRFEEIVAKMKAFLKQAGFADARFVPCCGLMGDNLIENPPPDHPLMAWYKGPSLLNVIDSFKSPTRSVDRPLRLTISDVFKSMGAGFMVSGKVETGAIQSGDKVVVLPNGEAGQIKAIQTDDGGIDAGVAYAGDQCFVTLVNADISCIASGHVICHPETPIAVVQQFQARIVVFGNVAIPLTKGFPVVVHCQCVCEPAVITRLVSQLNKSTGEVMKERPRCLTKGNSGVIEIRTEKPICLDRYEDCKELGRITLRSSGHTIAAGLVTKVLL